MSLKKTRETIENREGELNQKFGEECSAKLECYKWHLQAILFLPMSPKKSVHSRKAGTGAERAAMSLKKGQETIHYREGELQKLLGALCISQSVPSVAKGQSCFAEVAKEEHSIPLNGSIAEMAAMSLKKARETNETRKGMLQNVNAGSTLLLQEYVPRVTKWKSCLCGPCPRRGLHLRVQALKLREQL